MVGIRGDDFLTLATSTTAIPADGSSQAILTAKVTNPASESQRTVTFTTTAGMLGGAAAGANTVQVLADVDGNATTSLRSDTVIGSAIVTASVAGSVARSVQIGFGRAFPDRIGVTVAKLVAQACAGDSLQVTAILTRDRGTPTEAAAVEFTATAPDGSLFGLFQGSTSSSATGTVTVTFSPGNTAARGAATIRARVRNTDTGGVTEGTAGLTLNSPDFSVPPCG